LAIADWMQKITLASGQKFSFVDHEYEKGLAECNEQQICLKKGSQLGFTEITILRSLYGLLSGLYPTGVLYLLPNASDCPDLSRSRFQSLILQNEELAQSVQDTESMGIKKFGKAFLYLRGGRVTSKIEGMRKSSSQLRSIPCDLVVYDECDLFDPEMLELAHERLGHSKIAQEIFLSTPSVNGWGIDKLYEESDQRIWLIKCEKCGRETCLEQNFPACLQEQPNGDVLRVCFHCGAPIFPKNGRWQAQYSGREMAGFHVSQLNSSFASMKKILRRYQETPKNMMGELYNSVLAQGWTATENKLNIADILLNCGQEQVALRDNGPTAMGVDVGRQLHYVIGVRLRPEQLQIINVGSVPTFSDLHSLVKNFGVKYICVDAEPEVRAVHEFQNAMREKQVRAYSCDYVPAATEAIFDESKQQIKVNRTISLDELHFIMTTPGRCILPKRCPPVEELAAHLAALTKMAETDPLGATRMVWRKTGTADHLAHALNYFLIVAKRLGLAPDSPYVGYKKRQEFAETQFDVFNYGRKEQTWDKGRPTRSESDFNLWE